MQFKIVSIQNVCTPSTLTDWLRSEIPRLLEQDKHPYPLHLSTPSETETEYFNRQKSYVIRELQDQLHDNFQRAFNGKSSHTVIQFEHVSHKSKKSQPEEVSNFLKLRFSHEVRKMNIPSFNHGDIVYIQSKEKQHLIGLIESTKDQENDHGTNQLYTVLIADHQKDIKAWTSKHIHLSHCWVLGNLYLSEPTFNALNKGYFNNCILDTLLRTGDAQAPTLVQNPSNTPDNPKLNDAQKSALNAFIFSTINTVHMWIAPAGTGKSTTIVETMAQTLEKNPDQVIVACTHSNKAVIDLMSRFHSAYPTVSVGFIGSSEKLTEFAPDLTSKLCDKPNKISGKKILFCTLHSSAKFNIPNVGTLIIDEAGQTTERDSRIPLKHNPSKILLVGDPSQLPPTVMSDHVKDSGGAESLIEKLDKLRHFRHFFSEGYRMDPFINDFISKHIYNGQLKAHFVPEISLHESFPISLRMPPRAMFNILGKERKNGDSWCNHEEATVVKEFLELLLQDPALQTIAVITPYKGQLDYFQKHLPKDPKISLGTVNSFQGSEAQVVVLSLVRSNKTGETGFVDDPRLMNVALTRAKQGLYIFGNTETFEKKDGICNALIQDIKEKERHYEHSIIRNTRNRETLHNHALKDRIMRINTRPLFKLAVSCYLDAIKRGVEKNPITIKPKSVVVKWINKTIPEKMVLIACLLQYRGNGGLGKNLHLDPDLGCEKTSINPFAIIKLLNRYLREITGSTIAEKEGELIQRLSAEGVRCAYTQHAEIPSYVSQVEKANLAIEAFEKNQFETAFDHYTEIASRLNNPKEAAWAMIYAAWAVYRKAGHPDGPELAIVWLQKSLDVLQEINLSDSDTQSLRCKTYSDMGWMYYRQNKYAESEKAYQQAEVYGTPPDFMRSDIELHRRWGKLLFDQNRLEEARNKYEEAIIWLPDHYVSYSDLALVNLAQNNTPQAHYEIERSKEALERLYLGKEKDKKYVGALQMIQDIQKKIP